MPISWSLDDYPHFEFVRTPAAVLPGLQSARAVMENWLDEFHYMQQSVEWGVLTYTMHPYVIGRGYRMLALEQFLQKLHAAGAVFMTLEFRGRRSAAAHVRRREPVGGVSRASRLLAAGLRGVTHRMAALQRSAMPVIPRRLRSRAV